MVSDKLIVIGGRSNLSVELANGIPNAILLSSDDLYKLPDLLRQVGRCNIIYNLFYKSAWLSRRDSPELYGKYAFQRLVEFTSTCRKYQCFINKVLFTSSASVYGECDGVSESDICNITNLYSSLKLASEFFLRDHLLDTNIKLIVARLFNMYGGRDEFSVINKILNSFARSEKFHIVNGGFAVRDYIHIRDVVNIYIRLLNSSFVGVVNVGSGVGLSVSDLIHCAETVFGRRLQLEYSERAEISISVACIDTLLGAIGEIPFSSVKTYFKEQYSTIG